MSYLDNLGKILKEQQQEKDKNVRQIVRQKEVIVKQSTPKTPRTKKEEHLDINPTIKSIKDIPNVNIMTSGKLLGVRLRDKKEPMLKQFLKYLTKLLEEEKNAKSKS